MAKEFIVMEMEIICVWFHRIINLQNIFQSWVKLTNYTDFGTIFEYCNDGRTFWNR